MPASRMRFVETAGWLAAVLAILLVQGFEPDVSPVSLKALSLLPLVYGIRVFVEHGGGRISVLGLFNLSLALFLGYSGIVETSKPFIPVSLGSLTLVVAGSFLAQIAITHLAWPAVTLSDDSAQAINDHDAQWLTMIGAIAFVVSLLAFTQEAEDNYYAALFLEGASFSSVVVLAMGVYYRERAKLMSVGSIAVAGAFFAHVELVHGGTGRLRLVALACTLALLVSARFPRRAFKWAILTGTPLATIWLAQRRLSLQESIAAGSSVGNTGLESMTGTIVTFAQLLERQATDQVPLAWGFNFLSAPLLVVPQEWLPFERPRAFGYELVRIIEPGLGPEQSFAATMFGEWVFNFGILGFIIVVPIAAWALAFLDRRLRASLDGLADEGLSFMPVLVWILVAGSIADLTWNGIHILWARTLSRLPLIGVVGLVLQRQKVRDMKRQSSIGSPSRPRPVSRN